MRLFAAALFALFLAAGCSTTQTSSMYNPETDFSRFKNYAWLNSAPSDDVRVNNEEVIDFIRSAIDNTLAARGFEKAADTNNADILVSWFGAVERKIQKETIDNFYRRYGYGSLYRDPYWNADQTVLATHEYEEGRLIIDFVDPKNNALLWRGVGTTRLVEGSSRQKRARDITTTVRSILSDFPPR